MKRIAALVAAFCLLLVLGVGQAHAKARSEFQAFMDMAEGAGRHTITFGGGGVPIPTRGVPGPTMGGNMNFQAPPGGWPSGTATADIPSPLPGKSVPTTATQKFSRASQGKAIAKFAGKIILPFAAGMAIYELIQELGGQTIYDPQAQRNAIELPVDGSGVEWFFSGGGTCGSGRRFSSHSEAAACITADWAAATGVGYMVHPSYPQIDGPLQVRYRWCRSNGCTNVTSESTVYGQETENKEFEEVTEEELAQRIAAQSGWPSDTFSRALADAVNSGETLEPEGPLELQPQVQKVTADPVVTTSSDGSVKTTTRECVPFIPFGGSLEWRCSESTVEQTPVETTVVETNPDGSTSTTTTTTTVTKTTTTEGQQPEQKPELDVPAGDEIPRETRALTYVEEALGFGAGSCPAPIVKTLGGQAVTLFDYSKSCEILSGTVRPIVLVIAAWIAFVILVPGGVPVGGRE